jgi:O-methyltransferase involved in polyketide biosynthesis
MREGDLVEVTSLEGVSETLLEPLYNRASHAAEPNAILADPLAVSLMRRLRYPFRERFGLPTTGHVLRALAFDDQVRAFLRKCPGAFVVGLGEGLDTQFWRVDDGRVDWLAVDLPAVTRLRARLLQPATRYHAYSGSVMVFDWMDAVPHARPILVLAQGLLMYFQPSEVERLVVACAERFGGGAMIFDVIPRRFSRLALHGFDKTPRYRTPPMPWGLEADGLSDLLRWTSAIRAARRLHGWRRHARRLWPSLPPAPDDQPYYVRLTFAG